MRASKNMTVNWIIVIATIVIGGSCLCVLLAWDTVESIFQSIANLF
jgi:hypothetical protein